jgi:hypothetical protein
MAVLCLREDLDVNFILAERGLVLTDPAVSEPRSNINGRALAGHGVMIVQTGHGV